MVCRCWIGSGSCTPRDTTFSTTGFSTITSAVRLTSACDCWSLDLGVTDKSNPNEIEVRAQLTLVGLGSAGESRFDSAY